jgi:hypothetical protein
MGDVAQHYCTGELFEAVERSRGSVTERLDTRLKRKVWIARFTFQSGDPDHSKTLWLDGPAPGEWFPPEDARWFAMAIGLERDVAVKFLGFADACDFMARFKDCEIAYAAN